MATAPVADPKRPTGRPARLDSLKNPLPRVPHGKKQSRSQRMAASRECPNSDCTDKDVGEEDGQLVCRGCGTVVNDSNIVSEILFGESSTGKQMVQGGHVGADQSYSRPSQGMNHRTGGGLDSREITEAAGRRYVTQLGTALTIGQSLIDSGMQIFKLAAANNFIQGRRTKSVAAVCLYIACRIQKDTNRIMLIDFSDVLMLNVFKLGHIYKALIDELRINGNGFTVHPINPEDLILRFANRLEFGTDTMRVANDAVRIVQRFHRDWMTPGRRPAGVCGAALILAARMNNFRRTTREMVYVAKVSEVTIQKRLEEFKVTESSNLTVEEFRTIDLEQSCDPPAFYEPKDGKKKTRKRTRYELEDDGDSGAESPNATAATSPHPAKKAKQSASQIQQAKNDRQSMPPPPIPIDPALIQVSTQSVTESGNSPTPEQSSSVSGDIPTKPAKARRGRVPKASQKPTSTTSPALVTISPETQTIPSTKPSARVKKTQVSKNPLPERDLTSLLSPPATYESAAALQRALEATPDSAPEITIPRPPISDSEIISEEEFASDPEVSNCLLTAAEFAIKERIWTHDNRDYLRDQQHKLMKQQLAEANGTVRPVVKRKRKRGRMGDMSAYRDGDDEDGQIASSPAEAAIKMLKKRGFSKKINYDMLKEIYEPSTPSSSTSTPADGSRRPSAADVGSLTTSSIAASETADAEAEAEAEVEVENPDGDVDPTGQMRAPGPNAEDETTGESGAAVEVVDEDDGGDWNESDLEDADEEIAEGGYDDDDGEEAAQEYFDEDEYD